MLQSQNSYPTPISVKYIQKVGTGADDFVTLPIVNVSGTTYDVIVIGGGATGAGVARDCALRGLRVLLLERHDYNHGASGRNHGLMHSGARYAVTDLDSARECIEENNILRRIASHCIEATDGLFVTLPDDDMSYQATFVEACLKAGITAEVIDPQQALSLEPALCPDVRGAVRVPDATIDPFALTHANVLDARLHGADTLTEHEVTDLLVENGRTQGVRALNHRTGQSQEFHAPIIINAAGIWGAGLLHRAGIDIQMFPAKGTMLVYGQRVNQRVLNRCRRPSNADILVPDGAMCLMGTTSDRIGIDEVDDMRVTDTEVSLLMSEGEKMVPQLAQTRLLRAFAGVRPLIASDNDPTGRSISRGIVCMDHAARDGMEGLITITGGKLITYRKMAEQATDLACRKLGVEAMCQTATTPLPGSDSTANEWDNYNPTHRSNATRRHGTRAQDIPMASATDRTIICECRQVSVGEVKYAIEQLQSHDLVELLRRTRLGMGVCQGKNCVCRAANLLAHISGDPDKAQRDLQRLLDERWKGVKPVAWGNALRQAQLTATIYQGLCGLDQAVNDRKEDQP